MWLGIGGLIIIAISLVFYPYHRVTSAEAKYALAELIRFPLMKVVESGSYSAKVTLPNNAIMAHVIRHWGRPRYVISVDLGRDSSQKRWVGNINNYSMAIEVLKNGKRVELKSTSQPPYDYSASSLNNSLEFDADPGDQITINVSATSNGPSGLGQLILVPTWYATKDFIVGVLVRNSLVRVLNWSLALGSILFIASVVLMIRHSRDSGGNVMRG